MYVRRKWANVILELDGANLAYGIGYREIFIILSYSKLL